MSPFADQYTNFADCVRQNVDKRDADAYCGSIQARTENKMAKAVTAATHLNQAVRLALSAVAKHKDAQGSTEHHKRGKEQEPAQPGFSHGKRGAPHPHPDSPGPHTHDPQAHLPGRTPKTRYPPVRKNIAAMAKAHDPVKEEGDKKLKEADGVAADGAQDDQAFAVAFGPDNYDKLIKSIIAKSYSPVFKATRRIIHSITTERSFR